MKKSILFICLLLGIQLILSSQTPCNYIPATCNMDDPNNWTVYSSRLLWNNFNGGQSGCEIEYSFKYKVLNCDPCFRELVSITYRITQQSGQGCGLAINSIMGIGEILFYQQPYTTPCTGVKKIIKYPSNCFALWEFEFECPGCTNPEFGSTGPFTGGTTVECNGIKCCTKVIEPNGEISSIEVGEFNCNNAISTTPNLSDDCATFGGACVPNIINVTQKTICRSYCDPYAFLQIDFKRSGLNPNIIYTRPTVKVDKNKILIENLSKQIEKIEVFDIKGIKISSINILNESKVEFSIPISEQVLILRYIAKDIIFIDKIKFE